jgi:hypothetical protein
VSGTPDDFDAGDVPTLLVGDLLKQREREAASQRDKRVDAELLLITNEQKRLAAQMEGLRDQGTIQDALLDIARQQQAITLSVLDLAHKLHKGEP